MLWLPVGAVKVRKDRDAILRRRRAGIAAFVASLTERGSIPSDATRLVPIFDALTMPKVYGLLVDTHGWSADEYEAWLTTSLRRLALD